MFGYTQPYMFDRPLQFGFTVFGNKYSYNQARQLSIFSGQNLNLPAAQLQNLQNYSQSSVGFTTSLSYPLRRSFKRVGITYSLDRSTPGCHSARHQRRLFDFIAFRGISGPNAVNGIITSKIFPNFSFNTLDSGISPHRRPPIDARNAIGGTGWHGPVDASNRSVQEVQASQQGAQYDWVYAQRVVHQRLWRLGRAAVPALLSWAAKTTSVDSISGRYRR